MADRLQTLDTIPSPLFNHLVLERILKYLDFTDLRSFRLVCTFWSAIAAPRFIQCAKVHLEGNSLEQCIDLISTKPEVRQSRIRRTDFDNYTIKISSVLSFHKGLNDMWLRIHETIKILTVHVTTVYASMELPILLLYQLPNLTQIKVFVLTHWSPPEDTSTTVSPPLEVDNDSLVPNRNLRRFQLSNLASIMPYPYSEGEGFQFPISWRSFFIRFSGLEKLSLNGLNSNDITEMIKSLADIQPTNDRLPLRCLDILDENIFPETPNDDHFRNLANLSYSFESLHLEIGPLITATLFNDFLRKNTSTLRHLMLRRYPHPYMTAPITLEINLHQVTFLEISDSLTPSLSFLPHMPSLQTLNVILRDYRSLPCCEMFHNTPNPTRVSHSGVKTLYVEPPLVSSDCVKRMATCFPNLESLRIRVDNDMLTEVCSRKNSEAWQNLQELYITSWDGLTDEGITGISEKTLKFWGKYSSFDSRANRTRPYIGDLHGLQNLTIEMWSDYDNHISDWSVYYGILDLECLKKLTLIRCDVSSTAFKAIAVKDKSSIE